MTDPRNGIDTTFGSNSIATTSSNSSHWLMSCLCRTLQVGQSCLVIALAVAVLILGVQLHTVQLQLQSEDDKITALQKQVANQHQNQQDLNERVEQEHSLTLYQMAGTFALLTCLLTAFHIAQHLSNFHEAVVQRKIIAILWMSPIYSLTSFLSLVVPSADGYLAIVKDFYEAYTVYTFLSFLIAVLGRGHRDTAVAVLARHATELHAPTQCLRSFYYPPPETSPTAMANAVLMECQILAMQFVLVRPVTSIVSFVTENFTDASLDDTETNDAYAYFKSPNFFMAMLTNLSVVLAFNGLLKFYHVVRTDLQWCRPFSKFLSVKAIVFLTFWQGLTISIVVSLHYGNASIPWGVSVPAPAPTVHSMVPMVAPLRGTTPGPTVAPVPLTPTTVLVPEQPPAPIALTAAPTTIEGVTVDLLPDNATRFRRLDDERFTTHNATWANFGSESESKTKTQSAHERANQIQNFLICLEMLFFSMAHYCVFPAEEWKPDYRPQSHYAKPGIGLQDFVKDFSYIMSSSARRAAYHRQESHSATDTDGMETGSTPDGMDTEQGIPARGMDASRRFQEYEADQESSLENGTEPISHASHHTIT